MRPILLALALILAACAAPSDAPAAPLEPGDALEEPDGREVLVRGALVVSDGEARLCSALAESYPPQCAGSSVVLEGFDPGTVVGLTRPAPDVAPVVWSDFAITVRGVVRGGVLVEAEAVQDMAQATEGDLRLRFSPLPVPLRSGEAVAWALDLTNLGEAPVTVELNPAQPAEVVLFQEGEEAYRFSEGKAFTMSLEIRELAPGEPAGFVLGDELPVPPGTYTAVVTFLGSVDTPTVEATVTVEG